jgi:ABC-type dipeptide/oligopeptide/nickel transport system permease subunit
LVGVIRGDRRIPGGRIDNDDAYRRYDLPPLYPIVIVLLSVFGGQNTPTWIISICDYRQVRQSGLSQIFLLFAWPRLVADDGSRCPRAGPFTQKPEFILAARATGVSSFGIIFRHLPNTLGPVIVYHSLTVPSVMLTEAFCHT